MKKEALVCLALSGSLLMSDQSAEGLLTTAVAPLEVVLSNDLPSAVRAQLDQVVAIQVTASAETVAHASGVAVNSEEYLTAGHAAMNDKGKYYPGATACSGVLIYTPGKRGVTRGAMLTGAKTVASNKGMDYDSTPDIALVQAYIGSSLLADNAPLQLAGPSHIGQLLYATNYQPTKRGIYRNPDDSQLTGSAAEIAADDQPAIYSDVVIGKESNGDIIVAEGVQSFGALADRELRPGGSGGADYTADGKLQGLSVMRLNTPLTDKQMGLKYGVTIAGLPRWKKLAFAILQPVTRTELTTLEQQVNDRPAACRND